MIKKILIIFCLVISFHIKAQDASSSPYSFYGIGDFVFKGNVENRGMGGINMIKDSIHININNSASLADIMHTTFTIGGNMNSTSYKTEQQQESAMRASIDYIAIAIPISKKWVAAIGTMPFTSVGYKIQSGDLTDETIPISRFLGTGGTNKVYGGVGYKINEYFQVGADFNYIFGNITTSNITFLPEVQYGTREVNQTDITGFNFNSSLLYSRLINKKTTIFGSLLYSPETTLQSVNQRRIGVVQISSLLGEILVNEEDIPVADSEIKYPSKVGFGVGIGEVRKWSIGAEVTLINSSVLTNRFDDFDNVTFENSTKYNFGGFFIPDYDSFSNYYKRITYRAGFNYQNTGLVIDKKEIDNYGITFGLGFPIKGSFSNINVAYEYGKRGTIYGGLIEENFQNISISFSLNDKWFIKRKYD
jgi:hypothetical protein